MKGNRKKLAAAHERLIERMKLAIVTCANCGFSFAPFVNKISKEPIAGSCVCGEEILLPPNKVLYVNLKTGFSRRCGRPGFPAARVKVTQAFPKKQRISEPQQESSSRSPGYTGSLGEVTESGCQPSTQ